MCLRCEGNRPLTEQEKIQAELYKALHWGFLYGAQGMGKNMAAAEKIRERAWALRNGEVIHSLPEMPQKICNYRKSKLHWFGEAGNNVPYSVGTRSSHWAVARGRAMHLALEGKDSEFLKKFTGDEWVETRTLDVSSKSWEPQGEIFVMSGKPLKINDKSKGNN